MLSHDPLDTAAASPPPPRPLRVLLVISNLEYGGAQRQIVELANAADPRRMDVQVCSLSDYVPLGVELNDAQRRLHVVDKRFKFDVSVVPRLAALIRRLRADVVQSYLFDAEIAVRLAGRAVGAALVVGSERNTDYTLKRRQLIAYRLTRPLVDLIIANSNAGAAFNRRVLGQPASKYRVVHNGVNTTRFHPGDGAEARAEFGIAPNEAVVGMFASFKAQKNHPLLFAAARRVIARVPHARFLFVGDQLWAGLHGSDAYKVRMQAMVDELGIRDRCVFAGNRDDVDRLYRACDVTVLPSLFEGTPNVALESLASGVPVIATAVSDNERIIPDRQVGFIVPVGGDDVLAERLCELITNPELRTTLSVAARAWVEENFSPAALAAKTEAAFREALSSRAR
jgi:glycosyltransferase involved in cell wall biosynthesis